MTNLDIVKETLSKYTYVGIRGLAGDAANKKYRKNQILKKSFDTWDDADIKTAKFLSGTSAITVTVDMDDSTILKAINRALIYADNNKLAVISGDRCKHGDDSDEIILSTINGFNVRGARFVSYLDEVAK